LRTSVGGRQETFLATLRRVGPEPFKAAANAARIKEHQEA
jgi:sulfite reductase (NADPH) hemoprotein beta-component